MSDIPIAEREPTEDTIVRVANVLVYGKEAFHQLHETLISEGLSEEQFYLAVKAAEVYLRD